MNLSPKMIDALKVLKGTHPLVRLESGGTFMPSTSDNPTFEALCRRGLAEYRTVDQGSPYNGYAITENGRDAIENAQE